MQPVDALYKVVPVLPPRGLLRWAVAVALGGFACLALLLLFTVMAPDAQASPPIQPVSDIITGTLVVTHTANTTHEMSVFGDGRITGQYFTDDDPPNRGRNQIDQDGQDPYATTIAVLFDQHSDDNVDVGAQGEFAMVTPITLNTSSDIPGYSEDSYVVYASQALSYQITQRTLATDTNNCVIMEFVICNTGGIALTGGKLLYMVDIDVAHFQQGDVGHYDPSRRLAYVTDYNDASPLAGFAMGLSLLEGDLRGYGINGYEGAYDYIDPLPLQESYPTLDIDIKSEMITPTNSIRDGHNDVVWLVANVPDLDPGRATKLAFSLCAGNATTEGGAAADMKESFDLQTNLSVLKTAIPPAGSSVLVGEPITYRISISTTGYRYVDNVIVTDTVPVPTELITYSTSRGSIRQWHGDGHVCGGATCHAGGRDHCRQSGLHQERTCYHRHQYDHPPGQSPGPRGDQVLHAFHPPLTGRYDYLYHRCQ